MDRDLSRARIAAVTNLPLILNLMHSPRFVFDNDFDFSERAKEAPVLHRRRRVQVAVKPGRHQWETNFVADLTSFQLPEWRGARHQRRQPQRAVLPGGQHDARAYLRVRGRHLQEGASPRRGYHIWCVTGHGYSLLWKDGEDPLDTVRVDWKPGTLYAPPDGPTYHQHFNTAPSVLALSGAGVWRCSLPRVR